MLTTKEYQLIVDMIDWIVFRKDNTFQNPHDDIVYDMLTLKDNIIESEYPEAKRMESELGDTGFSNDIKKG